MAAWFDARGHTPVITREPGGTPGAETIRALLIDPARPAWQPSSEMLMHLAARCDHAERVIWPALADNRVVLSDRFADSTRVYQGLADALALELIDAVHDLLLRLWRPDLTLVLDVPVETGLARRAQAGGGNRYEQKDAPFHERVRQGFLRLAEAEPARMVVIDASQGEDAVARAIIDTIEARFPDWLPA